MAKVLVIGQMHDQAIDILRARDDIELALIVDEFEADFADAVVDVDAIAVRTGKLSAAVLARAQQLKIVARHGVGYDNVDVAALTRRGIPLAVTADANAVSVAEQALHFMLALAKRSAAYDNATRTGNFAFRNSLEAVDLWRKKVLILGFGRIGQRVAKRCLAFEMNVSVFDPYIDQTLIQNQGCNPISDLNAALAVADVVTLHFPGGGDNVKFMDRTKLNQLKPSAFLINTARGDVIDEQALCECLRVGKIAAAGLDVFAQEPTPSDHPLWQLDNVIVSPHSSATTQEGYLRMGMRTMHNVLDALDGKLNPEMVINKEVL